MLETLVRLLGLEDPLEKDRLLIPVFLGFLCGSAGKESAWNAGDLGLIPGLGRSPGEGKGYPFQYSGLENPMDCIVHSVANNWTQLSDFHFLSHVFYDWHISFHLQTNNITFLIFEVCTKGRGLPQSQVWAQIVVAWEALCPCCTEVDSWVSSFRGCDVQGEMFGRRIQWNSQSLAFLFALIWKNSYKELGTFPRFLLIPREILWVTICISAGDYRAVSLLDTQGRRTLLHLVSQADTCGESRSQRKETGCQII